MVTRGFPGCSSSSYRGDEVKGRWNLIAPAVVFQRPNPGAHLWNSATRTSRTISSSRPWFTKLRLHRLGICEGHAAIVGDSRGHRDEYPTRWASNNSNTGANFPARWGRAGANVWPFGPQDFVMVRPQIRDDLQSTPHRGLGHLASGESPPRSCM